MKALAALTIGLGLAVAAGAAYASPDADPSVIINKTMNSGSGGSDPVFSTNSSTDPIVVDLTNGLSGQIQFDFEPTVTDPQSLTSLYVQLNGALPGEVFFCAGDVFTGPCGSFVPVQSLIPEGEQADGLVFTQGNANEMITAGEEITVEVSAPEPQSWIMLVASLLVLLGLALKYREPHRLVE